MDINHAYTTPYGLALAGTVVYVLLAPVLVRHTADARVMAALPFIANTAAAAHGTYRFLEFFAATGYEPRTGGAIAAGLSEATLVWSVGAAASALIGGVFAAGRALEEARARKTTGGSIAITLATAGGLTTGMFLCYLRPGAKRYSPDLDAVALVPLTISVLSFTVAVAAVMWRPGHALKMPTSARWFWIFSVACGAISSVLFVASRRLAAFAAG